MYMNMKKPLNNSDSSNVKKVMPNKDVEKAYENHNTKLE